MDTFFYIVVEIEGAESPLFFGPYISITEPTIIMMEYIGAFVYPHLPSGRTKWKPKINEYCHGTNQELILVDERLQETED